MTASSPPPSPTDPMRLALDAAQAAAVRQEVPVGAVIWDPATDRALTVAGNRTREQQDISAHAELLAIRAAATMLGQTRLTGLDLYVTLEPCAMCAGAIAAARLRRVYVGALDPKSGGVWHGARVLDHPQAHHRPALIHGLYGQEAQALLRAFFTARRRESGRD